MKIKSKKVSVLLAIAASATFCFALCGNAKSPTSAKAAVVEDVTEEISAAETIPEQEVAQEEGIVAYATHQLQGNGQFGDPYLIYDREDLEDIRNYTQTNNGQTTIQGVYELRNSIDLSSKNWIAPSHTFAGTFNGNGYVIIGMKIQVSGEGNYGLFGINKGTIQNLIFTNISIVASGAEDAYNDVGPAAGANYGIIENCRTMNSTLEMKGYYNTCLGGITGSLYYSTVKNCTVDSNVTFLGSGKMGGIAGCASNSDIRQCTNSANINYYHKRGQDGCIGGIVGKIQFGSTVSDCRYLSGTIKNSGKDIFSHPDPYMGRIIGYMGAGCAYKAHANGTGNGTVVPTGNNTNGDEPIGHSE